MGEHAEYSPSAAHRYLRCIGSRRMEAGMPDTGSVDADRGTDAHQLAALCLNLGSDPHGYVGAIMEKGNVVDTDMTDYISIYVENINEYRQGADLFYVERKVDLSGVLNVPEQFGTADAIVVVGSELQVHDLKYGYRKVRAENNEQLLLYALGVLAEMDLLGVEIDRVRLVIHQPRVSETPDEWDIDVADLRKFGEWAAERVKASRAIPALATPTGLLPYLTPGDKQCQWCRAKVKCPAFSQLIEDTTGADFSDLTQEQLEKPEPVLNDSAIEADADYLGARMAKVDMIEAWCTAVRSAVETSLLQGVPIPGFKLVQGRKGSRAWTDAEAVEAVFKSMRIKQDVAYKFSLISPAQAEKALSDRQFGRVKDLISQSEGKPHVAPEDDKRPALEVAPMFDKIGAHEVDLALID